MRRDRSAARGEGARTLGGVYQAAAHRCSVGRAAGSRRHQATNALFARDRRDGVVAAHSPFPLSAMASTIEEIAGTATDRPIALDDRAFLGHPRGLGLLFITEMWERFSYYGMRALLVLYLVNALKWDTAHAANLYGTYTMLVYLTPVIGGYLADRFIGTRRSLVIGSIIISLGHSRWRSRA